MSCRGASLGQGSGEMKSILMIAGFRRGKSTTDQVTLLNQDIEDTFQVGEKAGVVLLDLTAAYDTVWHRGLISSFYS